jgi:hypothetical protein
VLNKVKLKEVENNGCNWVMTIYSSGHSHDDVIYMCITINSCKMQGDLGLNPIIHIYYHYQF